MARITVDDCLGKLNNRFQLVLTSAKRARQLATSSVDPMVPWDNDKPTVVALREIAEGHIDLSYLQEDKNEEPVDALGIMPVAPSVDGTNTAASTVTPISSAASAESAASVETVAPVETVQVGESEEKSNDSGDSEKEPEN